MRDLFPEIFSAEAKLVEGTREFSPAMWEENHVVTAHGIIDVWKHAVGAMICAAASLPRDEYGELAPAGTERLFQLSKGATFHAAPTAQFFKSPGFLALTKLIEQREEQERAGALPYTTVAAHVFVPYKTRAYRAHRFCFVA